MHAKVSGRPNVVDASLQGAEVLALFEDSFRGDLSRNSKEPTAAISDVN
jgi:hypothetical protein